MLANLLSALAGGGAGLLQLPLLLFLGLPFGEALVTHKIASTFLGVGASIRHWRASSLELRMVALLVCAGVPGVLLGTALILGVPGHIAEIALGLLTTCLGFYSISRSELGLQHVPRHRQGFALIQGALLIFLIGVLNGSLTSGTGLFVTICLVRWFGMDYRRAIAHTLVLVGLVWNGSGALALFAQQEPRWDWLGVLIVTSLLGGWLGTHLGLLQGNGFIKRCFEVMTIATGVALLWRSQSH